VPNRLGLDLQFAQTLLDAIRAILDVCDHHPATRREDGATSPAEMSVS
jgi:hypothetical protein